MRVLHWDASFLDGGGVANAVRGLAASQARLGAQVAIAAPRAAHPPLYERMDAGRRVRLLEWEPEWTLRLHGFRLRGLPSEALWRVRAFRPDIVHVHGGLNGDNLWVPGLGDGAVVFSPHGSYHRVVLAKGRTAAKRLYLGLEDRWLRRRVVAFHSLSPLERDEIARLLPGRPIYCVPQGPGIDAPLGPDPEEPAGGTGTLRFVCIGRLDVFTKGLDVLVEAFAAAARQVPGRRLTLTLVGPEWQGGMGRLLRRGRELGIAGQTTFTGPLSSPDVAAMLRRSHIYVTLARHDAFSLSVAEALLAGKPAILSEAVGPASYPEIAALPHIRVVPLSVARTADAMVEFVRGFEQLRRAAVQCQDRVREFFSWDRIGAAHLAMYAQLRAGAA